MSLPEWVKPGAKYRHQIGPFEHLYHVRSIVDNRAVVRYWSRRRGWQYEIHDAYFFNYAVDSVQRIT